MTASSGNRAAKLDALDPASSANVPSDWNAVAGDARILNKPPLFGNNIAGFNFAEAPARITLTVAQARANLVIQCNGNLSRTAASELALPIDNRIHIILNQTNRFVDVLSSTHVAGRPFIGMVPGALHVLYKQGTDCFSLVAIQRTPLTIQHNGIQQAVSVLNFRS